jgi:hypothetical protein
MVILASSLDGLSMAVWRRRVGARRSARLRPKLFDSVDR